MKTSTTSAFRNQNDEFSGFYNWSERTTVFSNDKKNQMKAFIKNGMIDLICMVSAAIAMVNCL